MVLMVSLVVLLRDLLREMVVYAAAEEAKRKRENGQTDIFIEEWMSS